mgnify:CR=1 FL=1
MARHASYIPNGVIPAVLLPFFEDLSIDEASFRAHLRDVTATEGISAITVKAETGMTNLEKTTETFADPPLRDAVRTAPKSLSPLLKTAAAGDGYAARVLQDPAEANALPHPTHTHDASATEPR